MKDFLGQELNIGDNVVIIGTTYGSTGTYLEQGKITKLNNVMASVDGQTKHPTKIIKIDTILNNLENARNI